MNSLKNRITWEQYALKLAEVASLRSEDPYKQVGACALDYSNRVIGVSYNGLAPGAKWPEDSWKQREERLPYIIHAETNLLSLFKRGECKTIACTLLPCSSCATAIAAYGIKTVVYKEIYKRDQKAFDIFNFYNINCIQL